MRDPSRMPVILDLLKRIWEHYPDLRFNQMIYNIRYRLCRGDGFHIEDDAFEKELQIIIQDLENDRV